MSPSNVTNFLQNENPSLNTLAAKLAQIKQWNEWLAECLPTEKSLLSHCLIVSLSGTSLIAIADSAIWVTRLRFYIPDLLLKLKKYPGLEKIQAICCKVQPNDFNGASKKVTAPMKKLSEKSAALLRETAEKMSDEKLAKILKKIAEQS